MIELFGWNDASNTEIPLKRKSSPCSKTDMTQKNSDLQSSSPR